MGWVKKKAFANPAINTSNVKLVPRFYVRVGS